MRALGIAGLPASGKSSLLKQYAKEGWHCLDDLSVTAKAEDLKQLLRTSSSKLAIADPLFCLEKARQSCERLLLELYPQCQIDWIYFENDKPQCLENAKTRLRDVVTDIEYLSKHYVIPEDSVVLPVYRRKKND